ncbi:MAG: Bax inhibitor-1/YccA family protein [Candidatus Rifleibacteriota bacterium]
MSRFSRTSNPAMKPEIFERAGTGQTNAMTINGATNKSFFLLLLLFVSASFTWRMAYANPASVQGLMLLGIIGGLITAIITIFSPSSARFTAPVYAGFEGLAIGGISAIYNQAYGGIVLQAILLTFFTAGAMLFLYRSGIIRVTEKFRTGIIAATMGIAFTYLISFVLSMFGLVPPIFSSGPMGIIFSLVVVVIAALNLILDFDVIVKGAQAGAPAYFEWYAAFGLLVTLVWLYLEILRLLSYLNRD